MTRRALIVGVSEYQPLATNLRSALVGIEEWRRLLVDTYGFRNREVRVLSNARVTKASVINRLTWLLANAHAGDQLVFIFCGHGVRTKRVRPSTSALHEEGLVLYPHIATDQLDVTLLDYELTDLYRSIPLPIGALPTFIFDCCFAAGMDWSELAEADRLPLPPSGLSQVDAEMANMLRFGLRLVQQDVAIPPLIVAAVGASEVTIEVGTETRPRSLFSSLAIDTLQAEPTVTYDELLRRIRPRMKRASQQPWLRGHPDRVQRPFFS